MGQALYRLHRPKKLSEVVGQEHVTTALDRALKTGKISHAYLLTGPRGVGKTTIARILAHEINGLPYESDFSHLDIIEIDAASNRRIDEIRELRDKVHIAPAQAKYKVYIIDEVHMLTREAFNALLKTLEEPPAHAVFILATTEVHKLPETIISRTQRYAFKPVDLGKVAAHLKSIAQKEGFEVDDEALELIARHGEGSFRDSISLLDQIRNSGEKVTLPDVQNMLGIAPAELIESIIASMSEHDAPQVVKYLQSAHAAGHEPARMSKQLGEALRARLLKGGPPLPKQQLMTLLARLIEVPTSADPKSNLEIALLDAALDDSQIIPPTNSARGTDKPTNGKSMPQAVTAKPPVQVDPHPELARKRAASSESQEEPRSKKAKEITPVEATKTSTSEKRVKSAPQQEPDNDNTSNTAEAKATTNEQLDQSAWPKILEAIKQKRYTLYSIVRSSRPRFESGALILECAYSFHQKKLNEKATRQLLSEIVQEATGQNINIKSELAQAPDTSAASPTPNIPELPPAAQSAPSQTEPTKPIAEADQIKAISNIFGGAELLES